MNSAKLIIVILGIALGLLASGGSGLWNAILKLTLNLKDIRGLELKEKAAEEQARLAAE